MTLPEVIISIFAHRFPIPHKNMAQARYSKKFLAFPTKQKQVIIRALQCGKCQLYLKLTLHKFLESRKSLNS